MADETRETTREGVAVEAFTSFSCFTPSGHVSPPRRVSPGVSRRRRYDRRAHPGQPVPVNLQVFHQHGSVLRRPYRLVHYSASVLTTRRPRSKPFPHRRLASGVWHERAFWWRRVVGQRAERSCSHVWGAFENGVLTRWAGKGENPRVWAPRACKGRFVAGTGRNGERTRSTAPGRGACRKWLLQGQLDTESRPSRNGLLCVSRRVWRVTQEAGWLPGGNPLLTAAGASPALKSGSASCCHMAHIMGDVVS